MDEKHVADYFIISGVSENPEFNTESKQLINSVLPITDVTVIFRTLGEQCPIGYTCIESTPGGHLADLNNGNFKSPNIQICYRRGTDKPPLVDVGVYHEDKERPLPDVEVVYKTPYGRSASTGSIGTGKSGTYITYRRAKTMSPFNQLVVVDLCVILNNKSEHPPHAFYSIKKNLNKSYYGMVGSEVFLCYKKTLLSPPSLCYTPQIISRFPLQDYANFPLPGTVPLFCLPTGANIELWPSNAPMQRPVASTFVLTSDSAQKIYGTSLSFYEAFDQARLTADQKFRLGLGHDDKPEEAGRKSYQTYAIKSICILSRWPFFECFERFLFFLHKLVFHTKQEDPSLAKNQVPLEHHISHFLLDVGFPTQQRPTIMVQLMAGTDETVTINQPSSSLPLPLTGASFSLLLSTLGVDNTMNVLLFGLCEQKILLHSLRPWVLTGVAEAITAMMFPFHWQCPYVPLCPLSLYGILNAPLPFIVGIDSRCFDTFAPPDDIICIDLDTTSIFLSELKKCLNLRILPKRAARVLRGSLEKIFQKLQRLSQVFGSSYSPHHRASMSDSAKQQLQRKIDLEIQEAFIRFMGSILRGFRSYLLPITKAPTVGATDPTSLFNFEEFLLSRDRNYNQFYQLITKTQMFTHYIEERSFVSDKDTSLAFFDDCEEKLAASDDIFSDRPIKLFDSEDAVIQNDRSVYIPAPELSPSLTTSNGVTSERCVENPNVRFGPLNSSLFHRHPQVSSFPSLDRALSSAACVDGQLLIENYIHEPSSSISISRRTKQEVKTSQKQARKSIESSIGWSKYLVSCCYCLWFSTLPSYLAYYKTINRDMESDDKYISRTLRYAYSTIIRMRKNELTTDEICFRVLTLLCGHYGQPALAVRVFFEMRKAGIKPNAVTYGYYNKAVLESRWPDHSSNSTTMLWAKIRNVISGVALFKSHGRLRMARRNARCLPLIGDPSFSRPDADVVDHASHYTIPGDFFHPTTLPLDREFSDTKKHYGDSFGQHRRSLINRSYSTYQKSSDLSNPLIDINTPMKNPIHKSYSMQLRDGSPERANPLVKTQSSSLEDDVENPITQRVFHHSESSSHRPNAIQLEVYKNIRDKNLILIDPENENFIIKNIDLFDSEAGILFTSNPTMNHTDTRTSSSTETTNLLGAATVNPQSANGFLQDSNPIVNQNHLAETSTFLDASSFGEDAQILKKLESQNNEPSRTIDPLKDDISSDETRSNKLSESTADPSESTTSQDEGSLRNITMTPNFKIASLINDASNLQWSKWTSSQNSKSIYKNIKSAATGIVSSLQEMKSTFSISNSNTPSKLLSSAQHKSTATREMLSHWANYFSSQPSRNYDDSDDESSIASNDPMRLSNDAEVETSGINLDEYGCYKMHFEALEKYYNTSCSKEDLLDLCNNDRDNNLKNRIAIEIKMTTCSRCNVCHSLLYDEEIMERWSHNESNLNTRCVYCRAKIVPLMTLFIEDRRFSDQHDQPAPKDPADAENLLDLSFDDDYPPKLVRDDGKPALDNLARNSLSGNHVEQTLTVPYLSPIVLRKELESVFESSGDSCPAGSQFVDEHPIIFWNLLWYFNRINVPTHLALLCLNSKSILNGRSVPDEWSELGKVEVKTLWDNEKLHSEIGKPLYRYWDRGDPSLQVQAILVDGPFFTYSFLQRVVNLLRANELSKAMELVLNARLKSSSRFSFDKNRHNLYRDLMFLANVALGPGKLLVGEC